MEALIATSQRLQEGADVKIINTINLIYTWGAEMKGER